MCASPRTARTGRPRRLRTPLFKILMGISANSGDDARDGDASDDGRSGRSTSPDDDDDRLAAYAAIYELVVSSPSTPRATLGWMNRMEYHLTCWRLSLSAIGAKMEFLLVQARAHRIGVGSQWSSCLGAELREYSFPPTMRVFVCGTRRRDCVNTGLTHPRSAAISHSKSPQPAALLTRGA